MSGVTPAQLEQTFDHTFADHRTILRGGAAEPLYVPPGPATPGRILFREDFVSSALHEVAHWCVAGARRRTLEDYGYWYSPDGRTAEQQTAFERCEVAPQALEWVFSDAIGLRFRPSADNVEAGLGPSEWFVSALEERREQLLAGALRGRALRFRDALLALSSRR